MSAVVHTPRRFPWPILLTAGAAVVAGALLAIVLLGRSDAPIGDASPSPSVSASEPVSPVPSLLPSVDPSSTPLPSETQAVAAEIGIAWEGTTNIVADGLVRRVTAEAGRYFALGGERGDATIWSSDDGITWDATILPFPATWEREGPVFVSAAHLVTVGDRMLAIGSVGAMDNLNVVVWESSDGASWTEVDTGSFMVDAYNAQDATAGPAGVVVISHAYGTGTGSAWRSEDAGRTWTEHAPEAGPSAASAVVGTASMYLMAGVVYDDQFNSSPRIWSSPDGAIWTPAALEGSDGAGSVDQITVNGDGQWVATGSLDGRLVAWRSDDGATWTLAFDFGAQPEGGYYPALLAGLPDGFVALVSTDGWMTWTSHDGTSWTGTPTERPTLPDGGTAELGPGIARIEDRIVVAGQITTPDDPAGMRWHSWVGTIED